MPTLKELLNKSHKIKIKHLRALEPLGHTIHVVDSLRVLLVHLQSLVCKERVPIISDFLFNTLGTKIRTNCGRLDAMFSEYRAHHTSRLCCFRGIHSFTHLKCTGTAAHNQIAEECELANVVHLPRRVVLLRSKPSL